MATQNSPGGIFNYPGTYNTTCDDSSQCFEKLNLICKEGLCLCIKGYTPNYIGGCKIDNAELLIVRATRFGISALVLILCVVVLYMVFHKKNCCGGRSESRGNLEGEGESQVNICYDEAPPPYLEVMSTPPPTYSEAIAKMAGLPALHDECGSSQGESNSGHSYSESKQEVGNEYLRSESTSAISSAISKNVNISYNSNITVHADFTLYI